MKTKSFGIWWLMFVLQIAGLVVAYNFEFHLAFWYNDITYISTAIFILWAIITLQIGRQTAVRKSSSDLNWFIADSTLTMGMIGTVIGFIYMLSTTFINLDPTDTHSMKQAISTMAEGMATALFTTLAGLLASVSLKAQLINQDN